MEENNSWIFDLIYLSHWKTDLHHSQYRMEPDLFPHMPCLIATRGLCQGKVETLFPSHKSCLIILMQIETQQNKALYIHGMSQKYLLLNQSLLLHIFIEMPGRFFFKMGSRKIGMTNQGFLRGSLDTK